MTHPDAAAEAPLAEGTAGSTPTTATTTGVGTTDRTATDDPNPHDSAGHAVTAQAVSGHGYQEYQGPSLPKNHHRDVNGGWLRPAVFGVTDGLVSNFSLLAGMAGGAAAHKTIVLTGLAGLVAGACSMAAGEYISVASQTEVAEAEIEMERLELARRPAAEMKELAEFFSERGVDPELAYEAARQIHRDPEQALIVHVQEELGVDPTDLPSPVVAAVSSFGSFAIGAVLPLIPYLLGLNTLWPAMLLAFGGLFTCGAVVSRVSSRTWWFSGLRQLGFGAVAAVVTYGLGSLIGGHLG